MKRRRGVRVGLAALIAALIATLSVVASVRDGDRPPSHRMHGRGECASCHTDAPRDHLEPAWQLAHGRLHDARAVRCAGCHEPQTCERCHQQPPPSHTAAFRTPSVDPGGAEHALLGRLAPEGCLVCHRSFALECTRCHTMEELGPLHERAREGLAPWHPLLKEPP